MIRLVSVTRAPAHTQYKWVARFFDTVTRRTKTTCFGHADYEDYTMHKDKERRRRYRIRHKKDLRTNDPTRAGYLSYYLLWGDSTSLPKNILWYKKNIMKTS